MRVTLAQIAVNRAHVTIEGEGGNLEIDYRPGGITPRTRATYRALADASFEDLGADEQDEVLQASTALLAALVISWNLDAPDGTPILPTIEGLADVDYATQAFILGKLHEAMALGEANAKTPTGASSSPGSKGSTLLRPASPRSRPNGAAPKRSPTG
jgi:hypothetical protein